MTDEEFERLKEAEKKQLRKKQQMRQTLEVLRKRNRAEGILQKMKQGAQRLLRETESLVDTLRSQVARNEAQLERAVEANEPADDLQEAEEALREERAESLIRQYKAASGTGASRSPRATAQESASDTDSEADASGTPPDGPDKTIGRMRTPRSDGESS